MANEKYKYSDLTDKIIGCVYYVYQAHGYGFLEKVYENALAIRLNQVGLPVEQQVLINVYFEDKKVGEYVADLIVNNAVIVEVKAIEQIAKIHEVQLVNYLKATQIEVGLLINFGPKVQIRRKIFSNKSTEGLSRTN